MATDDVIPAKNNRPNHITPSRLPIGSVLSICWNTTGMVAKPRSNAPPCAICMAPATPKNVTAAGIAIDPPSTTSAVSLVAAVAMPFSAISSLVDRYDAYACSEPMPTDSVKKI